MNKKIIIIGAGIAGLSAGCYARMNGYEVELYESNKIPGGLCTAWGRGNYTFDGCLHWLTGSSPADSFYMLWHELGAVQDRRFHDHEEFYRFINSDGRIFILYADADRLEKHMKGLFPDDGENIEYLCRLIRKFASFRSPVEKAFELFNAFDIVKMMWQMAPHMKDFKFLTTTTISDFAGRFKDPFLREVFPLILNKGETGMVSLVLTLALLHNKAGGFPLGGSLQFSRSIEKRLNDLGGRIFYKKRVEKIITGNGKASGIRLDDGTEVGADYIISAADLNSTVYKLLDGKYIEPQHEELFRNEKIFPSSIQVSYGVNMDLSGGPDSVSEVLKVDEPITIGNQEISWIHIRNFCFDRGMAPAGKSVIECFYFVDDFSYWEKLYADKPAYKSEKERIAKVTGELLEKRYPGFISEIEVTDVATPMTYVRYTGNYKGTYMTWIMTPDFMKKHRMVKKTLPGLENFWMAGMWVMAPGGVPTGAKTGRDIIQIICRKDHRKFKAYSI